MNPAHGFSGCYWRPSGATPLTMREAPDAGGLDQRGKSLRILELLLVPTDVRGIILLCGFIAAALFGLFAILTPPGDPIGWAYIGLAVAGYFFIQTRIFTTAVWLLVAAGGIAVALSGNASGWLEAMVAAGLAIVSLTPPPAENQPQPLGANHSSAKAEVSPTRTSANAEVSPVPAATNGAAAAAATGITVRCLGRLRIEVDGREVNRFQREPRLEFLVSYLIVRQLASGRSAGDRAAIADEVAAGISLSSQKDRLRKQINELRATDAVFKQIIRADRSQVWIDLDHLDLDVTRLLARAQALPARSALIDGKQAEALQALIANTRGEFFAGFSDLEQDVTEGRGTAGQLVDQVRHQIAGARAEIALALAEYFAALDQSDRAIPYLVEARRDCPDRQDVAKALVVAYLRTGQTVAATQVRHDADLKES